MPPKKIDKQTDKKNKKTSKKVEKQAIDYEEETELNDSLNVVDQEENDQDVEEENEADVEQVSHVNIIDPTQSFVERYEYKPVLEKQIVFVSPENRKTSEIMTEFEMCEVISVRAAQIQIDPNMIFTDAGNLTEESNIAEKELRDKKCPLAIRRMWTDKIGEWWDVNEMGLPS